MALPHFRRLYALGRRAPADEMSIVALLAGLLSGIIASMGMGGGAVLLIYLSVFQNFEPLTAQGVNLIFFIPTAVLSLIIYIKNKQIEFKRIFPLIVLGLLGALLGLYLTTVIKATLLRKVFGGFLIIIGIKEIFSKGKK